MRYVRYQGAPRLTGHLTLIKDYSITGQDTSMHGAGLIGICQETFQASYDVPKMRLTSVFSSKIEVKGGGGGGGGVPSIFVLEHQF